MSRIREASLVHEGGLRFTATTGTHRVIVMGDKVERSSLSPVETIVVCLAACSAMDVVGIALKKRQDLATYVVRVSGTQRVAYPQVFPRIDVIHEVEGEDISEMAIRRCIELSALKYCPVNAMLSAGATEVHHRYRIIATEPGQVASEGEVVVTGPYRRPDVVA